MPVVDVKESKTPRDSGASQEVAEATREFTVKVSDPVNDTSETARLAAGVPQVNDPHPENAAMLMRRSVASMIGDSRTFYRVVCEYSTIPFGGAGNTGGTGDKLTWPAVIRYDPVLENREYESDISGNPIQTVNGEPFDPSAVALDADTQITIQKFFATFDAPTLLNYVPSTNLTTYLGFARGLLLLRGLTASFSTADQIWQVTATIIARSADKLPADVTPLQAWNVRLKHQGYLINEDSTIVRAKDGDGQFTPTPVLLDATGAETTVAEYLKFQVYPEKEFADLGLIP